MKMKKVITAAFFIFVYVLHARQHMHYSANAQKKLVVFITGYNNAAWVEKTLDSVLMQQYQNFRVLYIDDASSDGAAQIVDDYIAKHNLSDQFTFIVNKTRKRKLANLYRGFYLCDDDEIVVFVDGDDWLIHDRVFERVVSEYQDPNIWMTYGSYCNVPKVQADKWRVQRKGSCNHIPNDVLRKKSYRKHTFIFMHLRTCYAWLLKQIRLQDLIAQKVSGFVGDFYPASNDLATFFPVVEMAHGHVKYIKELLYVRNLYSDFVGFKVDRKAQVSSAFEIRKKKSYSTCKKPIRRNVEQFKTCKVDSIIHVTSSSIDIAECIAYIQKNVTGYEHIFILYDTSVVDKRYVHNCAAKNNTVTPVGYYSNLKGSYQKRVDSIIQYMRHNYVLWINPEQKQTGRIDCAKHIYWLERTFADVTSCSNQNVSKKIELSDGVWVQLSPCNYESCCAYVMRKEFLQKKITANSVCLSVQ